MSFETYVREANDLISVVVQAEHIDAVNNIESIAAVPGIDAIFVGPFDLSGSLGVVGDVYHPQVQAAIQRVKTQCETADLPLGMFSVDTAGAGKAIAAGASLIAIGTDAAFLWAAAKRSLAEIREYAG
jgi:2-keto-3-deoxy-L-rhamnonate aldolase RhmA